MCSQKICLASLQYKKKALMKKIIFLLIIKSATTLAMESKEPKNDTKKIRDGIVLNMHRAKKASTNEQRKKYLLSAYALIKESEKKRLASSTILAAKAFLDASDSEEENDIIEQAVMMAKLELSQKDDAEPVLDTIVPLFRTANKQKNCQVDLNKIDSELQELEDELSLTKKFRLKKTLSQKIEDLRKKKELFEAEFGALEMKRQLFTTHAQKTDLQNIISNANTSLIPLNNKISQLKTELHLTSEENLIDQWMASLDEYLADKNLLAKNIKQFGDLAELVTKKNDLLKELQEANTKYKEITEN